MRGDSGLTIINPREDLAVNKALSVATLYFVACMTICDKKPAVQTPLAVDDVPMNSQYLRRTNADTAIVFVHGIFGGGKGTWTNAKTGAYWPQLLIGDHSFDNTDIYVFSYSSPYLKQSDTIDELIENMRLYFDKDEIFTKHKKVIFICHSMGGIVVRGYLKRYQAKASQVQLICFFSTPTAGAHITNLAQFLSNNPQIKGMLPANSDDYVTNLQHDWRALPYHVNSHCAYETLDTAGIRIVDEQSATALCDGPVDPIARNHIDIVKPENSKDDISYLSFRQAYVASLQESRQTEPSVTGLIQTARSIDVDCGQVRDDTTLIPPPIELKPAQKIVDAVASLQQASNLKEQEVEAKGLVSLNAKIHYRLVGLDFGADGSCSAKGHGVILVSFVVNQPRALQTAAFIPLDHGDVFLDLASKSGTLTIIKGTAIASIDAQEKNGFGPLTREQIKLKASSQYQ
jgi:hypothetical protein